MGTATSGGVYTSPAVPPSPNTVTVMAASVADPTRTASALATIVNPQPTLSSISPSAVDAGSPDVPLIVNGAKFAPQSTIVVSGTSLPTTYIARTQLTAIIPAAQLAQAGTLPVTVVTPTPGGGASTGVDLTVLITVGVSPSAQTVNVGQTQQFVATVVGSSNASVSWAVNDIAHGNATLGTINNGLYTAPEIPPSPNTVTVKAVSAADPTRSGTATLSVVNPVPTLISISPTSVDAGSAGTTLTATGSAFTPQSVVSLDGTSLSTTFGSSTQLTAVILAGQLASAGNFPLTVVTPSPGGGASNAANLAVSLLVAVAPTAQTLNATETQQFTATVGGSTNQGVSWSVNDVAGGNAAVGTVNASGLYTAPAFPPAPNTVTVKATSVADPTRTASASVTVVNPAPVIGSLLPSTVSAGSGDTTLTVTGTGFTPQSTVRLGSSALSTTFGTSTQLTAVLPAAQLASAGSFPATVVTPSPGGGTATPVNFKVVVVVTVSPPNPTVLVSQPQQLTATVTGSSNQTVTWSVSCAAGGAACGSVDSASGLYTAPALPPFPNTVTVKAIPAADPSQSGTTTASIANPAPSIGTISPTSVNGGSGSMTLTVNGTGFAQQSTVRLAATALTTTFLSSMQLTATIPAAQLINAGTFSVTVVTPGPGGGTSSSAILAVNQAPAITSANSATFTVGTAGSFTVVATGFPTPTFSETGALPSGVALSASGTLSGTPATSGTFPITITASNGILPNATQSFTLTVNQAPAITSGSSTTFVVGTAGTFTVTATGFPTPTFSETGALPGGVTLSASGVLSGTPTTGGTYPITITASNGILPSATQSFTLTVNQAPAITTANSTTFLVGTAGSFTVTATGFPAPTFSKTGTLPSGVALSASGVLSGTPTTTGTFPITITASNAVLPNASQSFTLTVNQAPAITSPGSEAFTVGTPGSFTVTATGFPTPTLAKTGTLPSGVTFNAGTGVLSGTPGAGTGGTYPITITASNGVLPNATLNFTLTVDQPPAITSATGTTFVVGTVGSFTVTATGYPTPTFSETGALPGGVTLSTSGVLSGTPGAGMTGTYIITLSASNGVPTDATQSFTLTVNNPVPAITNLSPSSATAGELAQTLTINGTNFVPTSTVTYNGVAHAATFVNPIQLTIALTLGDQATEGTYAVIVTNPSPGGGVSTGLNFKIWPSYPRSGAGSVLGSQPALTQIPHTGDLFAVLDWTSKDNLPGTPEDVLAADHALAPMGIPNIDTTDLATATANPFLAVAGVLNRDASLSAGEVTALKTFVQNGGTLYLWEPSVSALLNALGIGSPTPHTSGVVRPMTFVDSSTDPLLRYIDNPVEVNWQPSFPNNDETIGYAPGTCVRLGEWSTSPGDAAVLRCDKGTGRAYVFGWRLRPLMTHPERQLVPGAEPPNTNALVLDADICRLLMRGSYERYAATPQVRHFAPDGHPAALIITHDVDEPEAYGFAPEYADLENGLEFKSTFLFTTNPYDNGQDERMYVASGLENIQYVIGSGSDVESHSFGHFWDFNASTTPYSLASPNPPNETAGNYHPEDPCFGDLAASPPVPPCTGGMSVVGELGVSKWLLENDFGIAVRGFRSGYLEIPKDFLRGIKETGYQRDTTYALGLTRGSFPFVTFAVDAGTGAVTTYPVMEYPVAVSEDLAPLDSTTYDQYLAAWKTVIQGNYENNAPTIVLIHPVDNGIRIQLEQEIVAWVRSTYPNMWIGDWKTFAEFWEAQGVTCSRWP